MWAIVKVATFTLNHHVVLAYVMNQFKDHWLLDALTTPIHYYES
jgi:hypothetical protein